jgi:hypothetical protein
VEVSYLYFACIVMLQQKKDSSYNLPNASVGCGAGPNDK